jgi:hypothetical protein
MLAKASVVPAPTKNKKVKRCGETTTFGSMSDTTADAKLHALDIMDKKKKLEKSFSRL